jgi:adenosylmethionine-8-amino-7-oxononanoate aminotransferase
MIWAFDIEIEDPAFARRFYQAALERELLLRPIGNTIYFMPPYVVAETEMDFLVARTLAALEECLPQRG